MNIPTDYPVGTKPSNPTNACSGPDVSYADLKARIEARQLITDEMIRIARAKLDAAHVEPVETKQGKFRLSSIRDRFRAD